MIPVVSAFETSTTLVLLIYVVVRLPRAVADRSSRVTWLASLAGLLGLLCRGSLVGPVTLDDLLGGHNWLNLVQNLLAVTAFWLVRAAIFGLVRKSSPRINVAGLVFALSSIAIPFVFIDKGVTSGGRDFVDTKIDQPAMLIYVLVYMSWVVYLAAAAFAGMTQRRSKFYLPLRLGTMLVIASGVDYGAWAALAHWQLGAPELRMWLYTAFTPLFYTGVLLTTIGCLAFALVLYRQRVRAAKLVRLLTPGESRRLGGAELAHLYAVTIVSTNGALQTKQPVSGWVREAELVLSRHAALQLPDFSRPLTFKAQ